MDQEDVIEKLPDEFESDMLPFLLLMQTMDLIPQIAKVTHHFMK